MINLIGQSLGRYHILEKLGEGGMATVYKAYDTRLERNVAIKVILPGKEHSEKFLKRFEREAKLLAQLSHPNIVKVLDYGENDSLPYLVMEYIPGGTLKHKLTGKPIPWQEATKILLPIARALAYAHINKIIHRDIKPSNILITQSGEPMLSDFGIAKILEAEETLDLTGTGVGVGTPEYMSPEQAQGKTVDARSDIYSLGIVFYEMVTGRKPYQADTPMAVIYKLASESLPRPRQYQKDLPEKVEQVLVKSLAKKPENRFQDMTGFAGMLEKLSQGGKVSIGRPAVDSRGAIPSSVFLKLLIYSLTILIIGIGLVMTWRWTAASLTTLFPSVSSTANAQATHIIYDLTATHIATIVQGRNDSTSTTTAMVEATLQAIPTDPAGTVLFHEDFETGIAKGFNNLYGNWKVVAENRTNMVYEIDNENNNDYAGIDIGSTAWRNYAVEYRVKMLHHTSGAPEVILYFRSNSDGTGGYVEALTPYWNDVLLAKYMNGSDWQDGINHSFTFNSGQWYNVQVQALGSRLKVFVDSKLLIDTTDTQFSSGSLTFQVGPGAHVLFDDITVTALEP